ncbi:VOC family protein [Demetria terragena]|uniref:VOC family protein n=1 Tax=Demetria terragena TaxID=63959 RepID=UPI000367EA64|nr:VOC family protein [Demetria terragena]
MDQRVSFITLAVRDLAESRRFYVDGLGWNPELEEPGEVLMFRAGPQLILSLWVRSEFAREVGEPYDGRGIVPITLSHNVSRPEEVDAILVDAQRAGASEVGAAQERAWGGYTGYFADPDGFRWEVAHNPGPIGLSVLPT